MKVKRKIYTSLLENYVIMCDTSYRNMTEITKLKEEIASLKKALLEEAKIIMSKPTWLGTGSTKYCTILNGEIIATAEEPYRPGGL